MPVTFTGASNVDDHVALRYAVVGEAQVVYPGATHLTPVYSGATQLTPVYSGAASHALPQAVEAPPGWS